MDKLLIEESDKCSYHINNDYENEISDIDVEDEIIDFDDEGVIIKGEEEAAKKMIEEFYQKNWLFYKSFVMCVMKREDWI